MRPGALVEFLEDALRPHLPAPATRPARSRLTDALYVVKRAAPDVLRRRGFEFRDYDHFETLRGDGVRVRARHSCGSLLFIDIDPREIVAYRDGDFVDAILDTLDRAGCYCVPREVLVPCTAQGCEAAT